MTALKGPTAYAFFLAAFPGYFFYHVIKSTVLTPYVGWFSAVLIACTVFWLARSAVLLSTGRTAHASPKISAPFWLMIILMLTYIAANHTLSDERYINDEGLVANSMVVIWLIALYQIGRYIDILPTTKNKLLPWLMTISFAVCAVYFFDRNSGVMVMPIVEGDTSDAANYQGMARSIMCTALVVFPFIKNRTSKSILVMMTTAILYIVGSRTELILFAATLPLFLIVNFNLKISHSVLLFALLGSSALLITGYDIFGAIDSLTSGDASLAERAILFDAGIAGIIDHPIQGDYLGQIRDFGATGYYIHDILSMWQQFGLLGFAIYTYLIFMTAKIGYNCLKYRRFDPHSEALIYLSVASLIGVLTTKSIFWPVPALAWGLAARALSAQAAAPRYRTIKGEVTSP